MQQLSEEQQKYEIQIKRPFHGKFIKELNYHANEKKRKEKKKSKNRSYMSLKKIQKHTQYGLNYEFKHNKKMVEINKNGNKIIGVFKNNQLQGDAEINYHNGIIFRGFYQNGIKTKGHFLFVNGYEYIGNCLGNKFYGQGSLIFPSGKILSGQWKDYDIVGNAKIQYPKGQVYYGEVQNFKKHGQGHLFFNDNSKYVGQFKNGLITGTGSYYLNDLLISQGLWLNGQLINQKSSQEEVQQEKRGGDRISIDDIILQQKFQIGQNFFQGDIRQQPELHPTIKIYKSVKKVRFGV